MRSPRFKRPITPFGNNKQGFLENAEQLDSMRRDGMNRAMNGRPFAKGRKGDY